MNSVSKKLGTFLLGLLVILIALIVSVQEKKDSVITPAESYRVEKIIDGDTLVVSQKNTDTTVRLLGINTPEASGPYRQEECYGAEASRYLRSILPPGSRVTLATDPTQDTRDQYDRLIAYVIRDDGLNINEKMIRDGYAYEYTYRHPYQYQADFKKAEQEAKNTPSGVWRACRQ